MKLRISPETTLLLEFRFHFDTGIACRGNAASACASDATNVVSINWRSILRIGQVFPSAFHDGAQAKRLLGMAIV